MNTEVLYTNNDKSDTEHVALVTIQDCTKFDKFYVKRQKKSTFWICAAHYIARD